MCVCITQQQLNQSSQDGRSSHKRVGLKYFRDESISEFDFEIAKFSNFESGQQNYISGFGKISFNFVFLEYCYFVVKWNYRPCSNLQWNLCSTIEEKREIQTTACSTAHVRVNNNNLQHIQKDYLWTMRHGVPLN